MKICEKCGMEYGDDSTFCPYCDERYGVVIVENDVISADFPAYREEFPVIGDIGIKQESFAANRDEIYERNIRLAERTENILPRNEDREVRKSVRIMKKINRDGEMIIYAKRNTVGELLYKIKQSPIGKYLTVNNIFAAAAAAAILIFLWKGFADAFNVPDPYIHSPMPEYSANEIDASIPKEITVTSESGLEMQLAFDYREKESKFYRYSFELKNTTDSDIYRFWEELAPEKSSYKFYLMIADYSSSETEHVQWRDGMPELLGQDGECCLKSGERVKGGIWLYFED